jgi:hypothetical protein
LGELQEFRTSGCIFDGSFQRGEAEQISGAFYWNAKGFGFETDLKPNANLFFAWHEVADIRAAQLIGMRGLVIRKKSPWLPTGEIFEVGILNIREALQFLRIWDFYRGNGRLPTEQESNNLRAGAQANDKWWSGCWGCPGGCAVVVMGGVPIMLVVSEWLSRIVGRLLG